MNITRDFQGPQWKMSFEPRGWEQMVHTTRVTLFSCEIQYVRIMYMVSILLCVVVVWFRLFCPCLSGFLHWHWGNHMIAPVPVKQPWRIWVNKWHESTKIIKINTTKQSTTKQIYGIYTISVLHHICCHSTAWELMGLTHSGWVMDICFSELLQLMTWCRILWQQMTLCHIL